MTETQIKDLIKQELPTLISNDPLIRDFILRTVSEYYTPKAEIDNKFDRILAELQSDREEQARKWDEQNRKWDEANRKWDESSQRFDKMQSQIDQSLTEIKELSKKYDSTIGALGSRWGLYSEASFRNALKGILEDSFGVQVVNVTEFDDQGEVFGRPDQVEIDIIVKNGLLILCEIKSSIDKAGMYIFGRKADFYAKRHNREINRKMVICPMVDKRALPVAKALGIEIYSYADSVELAE
ncbi:MAG: DUF3782 domain-containing protein [Cyanobacterium sp. T60_A2020_053]|nr:DUF3782 domain-containing protein [Cyanobacterium sp. T60_A2020_053]